MARFRLSDILRQMNAKTAPIGRTIRILPQQPSKPRDIAGPVAVDSATDTTPGGFSEAFGAIGILLFVAAGVSACWTVWLIVLTIAPNGTANYLMDTEEFDDGHFWLIIDPEPAIMSINATALVILAVSYVHVMLKMTILRNSSLRIAPTVPKTDEVLPISAARLPFIGRCLQQAVTFWIELTGYYGLYRKFWNVFFKIGDVVVESIQLHHLLEAGFSVSLCYGYSALISLSCLSQTFFILHPVAHSAFTEVLVDTIFDMTFTVACPIFLLGYAFTAFDLDRDISRLNLEIYPKGSFERQARMQADPIVTTLFRFCFDSLRTLTWSNLVVRLAMNISFSYRLSRLVEVIYQRRKKLRTTSSKLEKLKYQRAVPRWAAALFTAASVFVLVFTAKCISESQKACEVYPQCVAFVYRWDRQDVCPCLALVDVDRAPKTYEEWIHPVDVTETVRALAMSGNLQVLQLTNRNMVDWPEELQRCTNLQYLSLYYTGVKVIPDWFKVFHKLEFLAMQGKFGETNTERMPLDAFSNMGSLTLIHLGLLQTLPELPSFDGLHNLKSISLALLFGVNKLPDMKPLVKLQRLELVAMFTLQTLPDISSNRHLKNIIIVNTAVCCNGFIGDCNILHPVCSRLSGAQCLSEDEKCGETSRSIFASQPAVCDKDEIYFPPPEPIDQDQIDICGGVMYRECRDFRFQSPGFEVVGMCTSSYFQVISCNTFYSSAINARRQEIARGIGFPCDPIEEAWLGCV